MIFKELFGKSKRILIHVSQLKHKLPITRPLSDGVLCRWADRSEVIHNTFRVIRYRYVFPTVGVEQFSQLVL